MHIKLKNKKLIFNYYKVKCAVGKRGISKNKIEGDKKTPSGIFKFTKVYYRSDRIKKIQTSLRKVKIKRNMGWCDDPRSNKYNKPIRFPFNFSAEKLFKSKSIYDILIVLNYNTRPVIKNKGSAIFLHLAQKNYKSTEGCIAVSKKDMRTLLKFIKKNTKIYINS